MLIVVVRDATPADEQRVAEVTSAAFAPLRRVYRPGPAALAGKAVLDAATRRLVAESTPDGIVVGTVGYRVAADRLEVTGLAVAPRHQRQGVARALIARLASVAAGRGLKSLTLYTIRQTGNKSVFERLGFRVESEQDAAAFESVTGAPLTEAFMRLTLPAGDGEVG
jgi:ribosomal protein S18 acetylase RimI-like enzyme